MRKTLLFSLALLSAACAQRAAAPPQTPTPVMPTLTGSEWLLEDLNGAGVVDRVQATLQFSEAGRVTGSASCNRLFGTVEIQGASLRFGPLGTTRRACPEAVMNQETKYLRALESAERFEFQGPYLLIFSKGLEKPLRFTRFKG